MDKSKAEASLETNAASTKHAAPANMKAATKKDEDAAVSQVKKLEAQLAALEKRFKISHARIKKHHHANPLNVPVLEPGDKNKQPHS